MPTFFRRNRSVEENRSQAPEKAGFEQPRNVCRGVFFTVLLLLFCSAFPPAVPLFAEPPAYTLAAYPTNDPKKVYDALKPLADHIAAETG